tara:strand:+ start:6132 stop:6305 length:174 start_codon:yes stop_codon:yes gene_type:complete
MGCIFQKKHVHWIWTPFTIWKKVRSAKAKKVNFKVKSVEPSIADCILEDRFAKCLII